MPPEPGLNAQHTGDGSKRLPLAADPHLWCLQTEGPAVSLSEAQAQSSPHLRLPRTTCRTESDVMRSLCPYSGSGSFPLLFYEK